MKKLNKDEALLILDKVNRINKVIDDKRKRGATSFSKIKNELKAYWNK